MKRLAQILGKTLLVLYLIFLHVFAALYIYREFAQPFFLYDKVVKTNVQQPEQKNIELPAAASTPSIADVEPTVNPNANINPGNSSISVSGTTLMIPVVGIKREELQDTYTDSRSEGRIHNAIDIPAANGTPVAAVSDGLIAKFFDSERGGITIYQLSPDKNFVYYYAHLQKRADNLIENEFVKQGTIIGYVGDTGNAGAGNYHLHFEIMIADDPEKYWKGTDINPFPLLKNGIESN